MTKPAAASGAIRRQRNNGSLRKRNGAIRVEVERRRRNRLLTDLLDSLDAAHGPVDETLVAKYTELL